VNSTVGSCRYQLSSVDSVYILLLANAIDAMDMGWKKNQHNNGSTVASSHSDAVAFQGVYGKDNDLWAT